MNIEAVYLEFLSAKAIFLLKKNDFRSKRDAGKGGIFDRSNKVYLKRSITSLKDNFKIYLNQYEMMLEFLSPVISNARDVDRDNYDRILSEIEILINSSLEIWRTFGKVTLQDQYQWLNNPIPEGERIFLAEVYESNINKLMCFCNEVEKACDENLFIEVVDFCKEMILNLFKMHTAISLGLIQSLQ